MKKAEIKRRKRVAPAIHDQNHVARTVDGEQPQQTHDMAGSSALENADRSLIPDQNIPPLGHTTNDDNTLTSFKPPLPVDFTHYRPEKSPSTNSPAYQPRKRKVSQISNVTSEEALRKLSDVAIDPALHYLKNGSDDRRSVSDDRRAQLQLELQQLRDMVEAKEREMMHLGPS